MLLELVKAMRPQRLYSQLAALFAILFALFIGAFTLYSSYRQSEDAVARLVKEAEALSAGLAAALGPTLRERDGRQMDMTVRALSGFPGLGHITITDASGRVQASFGRGEDGRLVRLHSALQRQLMLPLPGDPLTRRLPGEARVADTVEVWAAMDNQGLANWLRASFSTASVAQTRHDILSNSLWAGLVAAAMATLLVFLFLRRPMAHLNDARAFAEHLEYSYGDVLSTDSGVADIDSLTQALNKTSIRLYEQQVALARSEAHFRAVVEDLSELVFETDDRARWTYLNPAWTDITQYDIEEGLGRSVLDFAPEDEHPRINEAFQPLRLGDAAQVRGQFRYRARNGSVRWLEVQARARRGMEGEFLGYIGSLTDITARKQAEHALLDQLAFMEALIEAIPNPIYLKDLEGRYLAFNRAFEILFAIRRDEWLGKTVHDLITDGHTADLLEERDRILLNDGGMQSFELRVRTPDGRDVDVLYQKSLFFRADHVAAGILGCIADISQRKQFEQELLRAKEAAEAASKAKSDFLANVSHEVRTPLNAIIGMTHLTLDTELTDEQQEYLSLLLNSADSLLAIINDILDFSKIEAGHLRFENVLFNVHECVEATVRTLEGRAREKRLSLDFTMSPDIPENISGDPHRLQQVLLNLLSNALKFTDSGEVYLAGELLQETEDSVLLRFAISDTGIGIPPDKQGVIFEAFSQADTSITRRFGGTGLGLAICGRLVDAMGGKLWVESEQGQGSTFYFTASFGLEPEEADERDEALTLHPLRFMPPPRPLQLLLAEDNLVNQTIASKLLAKLGHQVEIANNGEEALAMREKGQYDVILMDIQMPVMSGLEAARAIREWETEHRLPRIPIIAMTAHAMRGDRERCLDAGMDGYVSKPILADALVAELATATQTHPAPHQLRKRRPARKGYGVFDKKWMLEQIGGDEALMHEVARIFVADSLRIEESLRAALEAQDWSQIAGIAHTAKGAASNFGSSTTVSAALSLERAARENRGGDMPALTGQLIAEMQKLVAELQRELGSGLS